MAAAVFGSFLLMAASLVRTSSDEKRVAWVDSMSLSSPIVHLIGAVDARAKSLRDKMAWRRGLVYGGYGCTLIGGGVLIFYVVTVGGIAPAVGV